MARLFLEERYRRAYILFLNPPLQGFVYELSALVSVAHVYLYHTETTIVSGKNNTLHFRNM